MSVGWLLLCVALAAPKKLEAEHTRLSDELTRLQARNLWDAVDRRYRDLEALEGKGVVLTYDDHLAGARSSRALGDAIATWERVRRAEMIRSTNETAEELARIYANFGVVDLAVAGWVSRKRIHLTVAERPFEPDKARAIDACEASLQQTRAYWGLLPLGQYTLIDQHFDVVGGPTVKVLAKPMKATRKP